MATLTDMEREYRTKSAKWLWKSVYHVRRMLDSDDVINRMVANKSLNDEGLWQTWQYEAYELRVSLPAIINASRI